MHHRITLCITITNTPTCTYSRYYPANGACRYILKFSLWRYKKLTVAILVLIVMIQQIVILDNNKNMAIKPYQQSISTLKQHDYHSNYVNQLIKKINENATGPFNRIDYM